MDTHDSPTIYGPLYGAAMLDLLGGPKIIWPSTVFADDNATEIPIWERDTQILSPQAMRAMLNSHVEPVDPDRDVSQFSAACLPPRITAFSLPRFVAHWWTHRASA